MIEKERKYIFKGNLEDFKHLPKEDIKQGYFINKDKFEGRVRIYDNRKAYITTKENTNVSDERIELEESVSVEFALSLLPYCDSVIRKTRYYYTSNITIDEFHDIDLKLVEIEGDLPETLPSFLGEDVTNNSYYKNKNLSKLA